MQGPIVASGEEHALHLRHTPEAADLLNAIYSDEQTDRQSNIWLQSIASDPALQRIRPNPERRETNVDRIITARELTRRQSGFALPSSAV